MSERTCTSEIQRWMLAYDNERTAHEWTKGEMSRVLADKDAELERVRHELTRALRENGSLKRRLDVYESIERVTHRQRVTKAVPELKVAHDCEEKS